MSAQQRNDGSSTSIWACSGDTLEIENLFFKHAIKHTPGESAVAAAALECEVQHSPDPRPGVLPFGLICFVEESHRCVAEKAASREEWRPI